MMQKTYIRRNWRNYPEMSTPINETNLNAMDYSLDEVDSRIIYLDTEKLSKLEARNFIVGIELNETTGAMTITRENGSQFTLQTAVGKIAVNFDYNMATQQLILYHKDGSTLDIDLSKLINQQEFDDSETIGYTVLPNGHIKSNVLNGSITESHLRPDYLADIMVQKEAVNASQAAAKQSEVNAEAWAVGTKEGEAVGKSDVQFHNNSMYYSTIAQAKSDEAIEQVAKAQELLDAASKRLSSINFWADLNNGHLYYETASDITFYVDVNTGHLMFEV